MKTFLLRKFNPGTTTNRMAHVGDVENARDQYLNKKNKNLLFLLDKRFSWMNKYIDESWVGIELGAGVGASRDYIKAKSLVLTDYAQSEWLDIKNVDALETKLPRQFV